MCTELLAHVKQDDDGQWHEHTLETHLKGTAKLAEEFASVFGLEILAEIVAKAHDYGKASQKFQDRINPELHVNLRVDHSTAGAQFLVERYGEAAYPLAYIVAGHHGGLPNGKDENKSSLSQRLKRHVEEYRSRIPDMPLPEKIFPANFLPRKMKGKFTLYSLQFTVRMLYSVLTDSDFLDTEAFMNPKQSAERQRRAESITNLYTKLEQHIATLTSDTFINQKRARILGWCKEKARQEPGIFTLTVPTGGGKTISSMAFALKHAQQYNLRRVIYVIPYTSIITQNAEVFRRILDDDAVLEHHSNLDPKLATAHNRLASQNWDAPIIVTTNVQFFESFYHNRSSACRKLHNVADSVLIFDEAQMFPPELLKPTLAVIRELVNNYGCTAVLCTATQPTLTDSSLLNKAALEKGTEIIPNPQQLYEELRRVDVTVHDEPMSYKAIAQEIAKEDQILVIVNTRKDARKIFEQLLTYHPVHECFHLSTMMCPAHRSITLKAIRACLEKGMSCRVVSTQLIEAGVDVDFPVVWRAIAGLDSIAQAAGRCNREWTREKGRLVVFYGERKPPPGHLRQAAESGERVLKQYQADPLSLEAVERYFNDFFWKRSHSASRDGLDRKDIMQMCKVDPKHIPFRDIAREFKIIDEPTYSILIPYRAEGKQVIAELEKCRFHTEQPGYVNQQLRKTLQRYTVQLRECVFREFRQLSVIEDIFDDEQFWVLRNSDVYTENIGLHPENPVFMKIESLII
ncbi:CRISPR-associated helicase/endonuclease Cas3 [candidate division KSB3 bacterium]|uniref:CRISPR-associated helicase/endonuclease Cas3 n=1 Tax=candidate division KSB3 bacterium TaxID=2044937 RepID=A0A2G6E226_9BACT|nr:MAG: CRISPR-associated helicase/endonuclease Cas3 [candidate division KSB3 bacterium]PIE28685.1 MAG: CRISPR-associated helicase/endonuclease Cas3 [candidate division KSB3 bacterium]